jgi:Cdc6-like AAA superfamily ATPase
MINEININGWNNKVVTHPKLVYPQCNDDGAPRNYFVAIFAGARGSGKTYLLTKLLKTFEEKKCYKDGTEVPQRIILVSPTAHSDSNQIFKSLKNLDWDIDVITEYSDDILKNKMEEVKAELLQSKEYKEYKRVWAKFKKVKVKELTDDECVLLMKYNFEDFEDIPPPKYPDGFLVHWIVDDMIGSNIFKNGRSAFTNLVIRNRHVIPGNIIIATQSIMQIPKTIRLNSNLIVMFKFANKKAVMEDIHPVVSAYVTEEKLMELYEHATKEAHDALVIDGTGSKILFKKNFNVLLELK